MHHSVLHLFDLAEARVPTALRPTVEHHWHNLREQLTHPPRTNPDAWVPALPRVLACSDFAARTCVAHPELLRELIDDGDLFRAYKTGEIGRRVERTLAGVADEAALKARLRRVRRREMLRIAFRDLAGWSGLDEVLATVSELAEACIGAALTRLEDWARARFGEPRGEHGGEPVALVVLGVGKLGGHELNFSSDVDLIFCYSEEGETSGERALSNHEFFIRLGQALINVLGENTADGFVFRVDMRLRPNGASGPLVLSFDAMEHYYQTHGREWERYALIKARVVAGEHEAGSELLSALRPFMFRKYLDYGAIEGIRGMKALIEREVGRKGMQSNIKLGPGGIREIEFVVQALQLVRGGREPALQAPRLLTVLPALAARGYLPPAVKEMLTAAYVFLRTTEHRLQMINDAQTQTLPGDVLERGRLAFACGYSGWDAFERELMRHRQAVQNQFAQLFRTSGTAAVAEEAGAGLEAVWLNTLEPEAAHACLRQAGYEDPEPVMALLQGLRKGSTYKHFSSGGRTRMDRVVPRLLAEAGKSPDPLTTLGRLIRLLEAIGRRTVYYSLLYENPQALAQLVKLGGASPWIANWIARHPILLDELIDPRALYELPAREELDDELRQRLAHIPEEDLELQMEVLREFRHGHLLRVAAADLARGGRSFGEVGRATQETSSSVGPTPPSDNAAPREGVASDRGPGLTPDQVGLALAAIAEVVLEASLGLVTRDLVRRHGRPRCPGNERSPGFAVIGYGKLGSHELGYGSDLDMIFVYEGGEGGVTDGPRSLPNEQYFARLGQRLIHVLTTRTPGGILYEVDMRLRPSGKSGPLVVSLDAFEAYQREHAWTWEHQALVRARPVAGNPELCREFSAVRHKILCRERDPERLRRDVREMRSKMLAEHASKEAGLFDVKHDRGGIVDIEFMVQYGVLRWAHDHPDLTRHTDNINILKALAQAGLLENERARLLVDAYHRYLSIEHRLKLMERGALIPRAELDDLPDKVAAAWDEMIGQEQT